jgi:hypothetical protein
MDTNAKGELAMLQVQLRALEIGALLSKPLREAGRYDLIIDWQRTLYRAQVKYCDRGSSHSTGAVTLRAGNITRNRAVTFPCYTAEEIDALLVYVPKMNEVLWLPPAQFDGKQNISLRYQASLNNQAKGCLWAADFIWGRGIVGNTVRSQCTVKGSTPFASIVAV